MSAAVWQTIQRKVVSDYGMIEEFVSTVTDILPDLLSTEQKAQLTLGLRAQVLGGGVGGGEGQTIYLFMSYQNKCKFYLYCVISLQ